MIHLRVRPTVNSRIPTASMADIAFLLLIFFLTSTIFRMENGLEVDLPRAESGIGAARQRSTHIWVDRSGQVAVDDYLIEMETLDAVLAAKLKRSGELLVSLQIDRDLPYETVDQLLTQIKRANVRNLNWGTEDEKRIR